MEAKETQLFLLSAGADPVKIGNVIKAPEPYVTKGEAVARNKYSFTATVEFDEDDAARLRAISKVHEKAENMAAELNDMIDFWRLKVKYEPRAERRAFRRAFDAKLKIFKAYCAANNITYTIKQNQK